ncbi:DNA-binding transcriptional regulator, AcrR family [Ferrimonas sediminum]|uniref:DNA-binding transcriptional regulator, AcrR family n=1 Tax=Ferrimonas sediminum TaxID=718193 RepID=A0A1G8RWH9_9GAMM|nr:TetR/AcrR family transcriptional regulator [Ferrimonas sediminum]SDJ21286.1 DNA-binding transcriptional regulator, AcrR family [Ferrimonas sediminum]
MVSTPNRSKKRILTAFQSLLGQKDYCDITVSEIIDQANVGKTTFYRHYERKLDLFVALHQGVFSRLLEGYSAPDQWLDNQPPPSVVNILDIINRESGFRRSMPYKLGNDWNQALRLLKGNLAKQIAVRLAEAFKAQRFDIEITELSGALAALMIEIVVQVVEGPKLASANGKATTLQRLIQAQVHASITLRCKPNGTGNP